MESVVCYVEGNEESSKYVNFVVILFFSFCIVWTKGLFITLRVLKQDLKLSALSIFCLLSYPTVHSHLYHPREYLNFQFTSNSEVGVICMMSYIPTAACLLFVVPYETSAAHVPLPSLRELALMRDETSHTVKMHESVVAPHKKFKKLCQSV